MPIFNAQCPYCLKEEMSFRSTAVTKLENGSFLFSSYCPNCLKPVGAIAQHRRPPVQAALQAHAVGDDPNQPYNSHKMLRDLNFPSFEVWPKAQKPVAPEHISNEVGRIFLQGEASRSRGERDAAGMCFRRVVEIAIRERQGKTTGNLKKDILAFGTSHGLTQQVIEWADLIRDVGNDATHDPGQPSVEEIDDLAAFTRVFLEYVFTLPEQVRLRIAAQQAKSTTP